MAKKQTEEEQYRADVYAYMDKLPACVIAVDKLAKPETREQFIETVKSYINEKSGQNGYVVEFSSDYQKIKKWDTIICTPAERLQAEIKKK